VTLPAVLGWREPCAIWQMLFLTITPVIGYFVLKDQRPKAD